MSNNKDYVIFRLTTGKVEGTWTLPRGTTQRDGVLKFIDYFPGSSSYFVEDNKDSIYQQESPVFEYNDILSDPGCDLAVHKSNTILINLLKIHNLYGIKYKIHDPEAIAEEKSKQYDKIGEAFEIISKEIADIKIQAMAVSILGNDYINESTSICKAALKEMATRNPDIIINSYNNENYYSKFLAALAFKTKVVKLSEGSLAVLWNDSSESVIVNLAVGQDGQSQLANLLNQNSRENTSLLQAMQEKVDAIVKATDVVLNSGKVDTELLSKLDEKDSEIEALKKQIESLKNNPVLDSNTQSENSTSVGSGIKYSEDMDLEYLQQEYVKHTGKELPPKQKNDKTWLVSKLQTN